MKDHRLLRRSPDGSVSMLPTSPSTARGTSTTWSSTLRGGPSSASSALTCRPSPTRHPEADAGRSRWERPHTRGRSPVPRRLVITPWWHPYRRRDGRRALHGADSYAGWLVGDRAVWAQVADAPDLGPLAEPPKLGFAPDGCALDSEGCIWAADAVGARCAPVAQGGWIVDQIPAPPGLGIFACMLGGEDGLTLLMCAAPDFLEVNRAPVREAVLLMAASRCRTRVDPRGCSGGPAVAARLDMSIVSVIEITCEGVCDPAGPQDPPPQWAHSKGRDDFAGQALQLLLIVRQRIEQHQLGARVPNLPKRCDALLRRCRRPCAPTSRRRRSDV